MLKLKLICLNFSNVINPERKIAFKVNEKSLSILIAKILVNYLTLDKLKRNKPSLTIIISTFCSATVLMWYTFIKHFCFKI